MDSSGGGGGVGESELFLQWGNRKRNRCARTNKDPSSKPLSDRSTRTITATFIHDHHHHSRPASTRFFTREDESKASAVRSGPRKSSSSSPENYYTTRGSVVNGAGEDGVGKKKKKNNSGGGNGVKLMSCNNNGGVEINKTGGGGGGHVWPKLYLGLSNKEKEEDFMAMKGCKPPHRPKKRPKGIQRSVLLVCPGGWLADMCQERYEVREKKSSKKRPRGLKAMGSLESDSE